VSAVSESLEQQGQVREISLEERHEQTLIRACQSGDLNAFDEVVKLYQDKVFGLAMRMLRNHDEAEDVAQEVFLSCYRNITNFRFESRFSTWIFRVTVNRVKNRWKYLQRRHDSKHESLDAPIGDGEETLVSQLASPRPDPRQHAEGRQMAEILQQAIATLSEDYQEILALRFVQGLQYEEIADVLQCSLGTVKSRINRARHELRDKMKNVL
jgi:RNA polymerase sigma-70 factor, ECF subfamily